MNGIPAHADCSIGLHRAQDIQREVGADGSPYTNGSSSGLNFYQPSGFDTEDQTPASGTPSISYCDADSLCLAKRLATPSLLSVPTPWHLGLL